MAERTRILEVLLGAWGIRMGEVWELKERAMRSAIVSTGSRAKVSRLQTKQTNHKLTVERHRKYQEFCALSEAPRFGARDSPTMGSPCGDVRGCVSATRSAGIEKGNGSAVAIRSGVQ